MLAVSGRRARARGALLPARGHQRSQHQCTRRIALREVDIRGRGVAFARLSACYKVNFISAPQPVSTRRTGLMRWQHP
eukprot:10016615-Alexandrium_andersonii.AAC.1